MPPLIIEKGKDISRVVQNDLCMGCGTCVSLCPTYAIELDKNKRQGCFLAEINQRQCTSCGICHAVCPGNAIDHNTLSSEFQIKCHEDERLGTYSNCYLCHASDQKIRYQRSSGGIVTAMLQYLIQNNIIDGALVVRLPQDGSLTPQPYIARNNEDILDSARSLYCPVPANIAIRDILETPGRYAVVGLPCHIDGIRKAERFSKKLRRRIVLHLGLFCGWGTPFTGTDFIIDRMGLQRSEVKSVAYRGNGWPGGFMVELEGGKKIFQEMSEGWDRNLSSFKVNRCMYCHDLTAELADVSLGDAWLPEVIENDSAGSNLVIVRSDFGEEVFAQMNTSQIIWSTPIEKDRVTASQNNCEWKKSDISGRIKLTQMLGKKVPDFGQTRFPSPSLISVRNAAIQHLQMILASRRTMWWLLRLLNRVIDAAERFDLVRIPHSKKEMNGTS